MANQTSLYEWNQFFDKEYVRGEALEDNLRYGTGCKGNALDNIRKTVKLFCSISEGSSSLWAVLKLVNQNSSLNVMGELQ